MKYAFLGSTGVRVSRIGVGTATFGVAPLAEQADRIVGRALDLGVNLFDTANSYGNQSRFDRPGAPPAEARASAEEMLGRALGARRQDVVLCSKVMEPVGSGPNDAGLSRLHIFNQVEASLRRLKTDHLDVYYAHHPDRHTPLEQTIGAMDDLVRQGKIRYFALSTYPAWEMTEALWVSERLGACAPVCNQLSYSLANRAAEREVVPACLRFGLSVVAYSPLGGGLLAGEEALNRSVVGSQRWGMAGFTAEQMDLAHRFNAVAREWGIAPAALALAWLTAQPSVCAALIGPETVAEMEANALAGALELDARLVARLDTLGQPPVS